MIRHMALAEVHDFPEPDRFADNVARNIRSLLAMRGIAAKKLAQQVGMSDTTLSQRMGGHNRWLGIELHRIARAFAVPTDVLFAETEQDFLDALARSRCFAQNTLFSGASPVAELDDNVVYAEFDAIRNRLDEEQIVWAGDPSPDAEIYELRPLPLNV